MKIKEMAKGPLYEELASNYVYCDQQLSLPRRRENVVVTHDVYDKQGT
jgi:hypothetical protein